MNAGSDGLVGGVLRSLGILGATLLLVGALVTGVGFANAAYAEHQVVNCTGNCNSLDRAEANSSFESDILFGVGVAIVGVGLGIVLAVATRYMSRGPAGASGPE